MWNSQHIWMGEAFALKFSDIIYRIWARMLLPYKNGMYSIPALVKVMVFFLTWTCLWLPIAIIVAIALKWQPPQPLGNKKLPLVASLYLIVPFILWATTLIESVSLADWGLFLQPATLISALLGLGLGIVSLAILFGLQLALGWIELQSTKVETKTSEQIINPWASILNPSTLLILLLALWISATEELIFRGCLPNLLQQDYSIVTATAIASFIFAIAHLIWAPKETLPQLPGLWLMGIVLTLARVADGGSLGIAIGLHAAWIWGITIVDTAKLIKPSQKVPEWITGIAEKPLAGAAGIMLLLTTGTLLFLMQK